MFPFCADKLFAFQKGLVHDTKFCKPKLKLILCRSFLRVQATSVHSEQTQKASLWKPNPAVSTKPPTPGRCSYHETQTAMGSSGCTSSLKKMPIEVSNICYISDRCLFSPQRLLIFKTWSAFAWLEITSPFLTTASFDWKWNWKQELFSPCVAVGTLLAQQKLCDMCDTLICQSVIWEKNSFKHSWWQQYSS